MKNGYEIIKLDEEITPLGGVLCINECTDNGCFNPFCDAGGDFQCCNADPFCDCLMECYCATNEMDCSTRIGNR